MQRKPLLRTPRQNYEYQLDNPPPWAFGQTFDLRGDEPAFDRVAALHDTVREVTGRNFEKPKTKLGFY